MRRDAAWIIYSSYVCSDPEKKQTKQATTSVVTASLVGPTLPSAMMDRKKKPMMTAEDASLYWMYDSSLLKTFVVRLK